MSLPLKPSSMTTIILVFFVEFCLDTKFEPRVT